MRTLNSRFLASLAMVASALFLASTAHAGQFNIQIGDTVEEDSPDAGAGRLDASTETDVYRFTATAGQLAFFEEISDDPAFEGWLLWEVTAPSGNRVFSEYLDNNSPGRVKLEENGTYQVRVFLDNHQPSFTGSYSFAIHEIPPDQTFSIAIGDTVSADDPQPGAGMIEVAGAQDSYTFSATAGQHIFFEEISGDGSFNGWLQYELFAPSGTEVFSAYSDSSHTGRETLPETGTYKLVVASPLNETDQFGEYSFRIRAIPPDQEFTISVGDTVAQGVPGGGAGRIEVTGARDIYRFQANAGQALFFEDISAAPEFEGWLTWEVRAPGGTRLFSDYFDNSDAGRKDLTESGTYTITVYVPVEVVEYVGDYSFQVRAIGGDTRYPIQLGQVVTNGVPGAGAGMIESPGGEDQYRFDGQAGQAVIFEELAAAAVFEGWLRWEMKGPGGATLLSGYFDSETAASTVLPQGGTYTVRIYSGAQEVDHVGGYSFRVFSPVKAWADNLDAPPGKSLVVPIGKLLCNDSHGIGDSLTVDAPLAQSLQGGTVAMVTEGLAYTPKAGFSGIDSFAYRIRGAFGGEDTAMVTVRVFPGAEGGVSVVSVNRISESKARVCLLGLANQTYRVEESTNLHTWTFRENITASATGEILYEYDGSGGGQRFFRFARP